MIILSLHKYCSQFLYILLKFLVQLFALPEVNNCLILRECLVFYIYISFYSSLNTLTEVEHLLKEFRMLLIAK